MRAAVFLDRDGVLNPNVRNPDTGFYESPHRVEDFTLYPDTVSHLQKLQDRGYALFLVSNQPSFALGKTTMEQLQAIHRVLHQRMTEADIQFTEYYYCYHHPDGVVPDYRGACRCRKPSGYFLECAARDHHVDLHRSWIVGDRDTDVQMAGDDGPRTILIRSSLPGAKQGQSRPDYEAENLGDAVRLITQADQPAADIEGGA